MPQLEGLSSNTETIRMYYSFSLSRYELESRKAIPRKEIIRKFVSRGVTEICSECTRQRYYVVGLERGEIIQVASPESNDMSPKSLYISYNLTLGLYVRRFATRLTGDELYYWSRQSSERILFEMSQLENRRMYETEILYTPIDMNQLPSKIPNESIFKGEMARFFGIDLAIGVDTRTATAVIETERRMREEVNNKPKRTEYTIIRRPKLCSNQSC